MNEVDHPSGKSLSPGKEEDDGAVLRAVRAFLLDDDVIGALDSDGEKSSSGPFSGDSSTESSGSATDSRFGSQRTYPGPGRGDVASRLPQLTLAVRLVGPCTKSLVGLLLCATSVSSVVKELFDTTTTETQRTQRLHRENRLFVQSLVVVS